MAKAFEAKYPGIKVAVERTGAERLFNRIAQETASNIHRCRRGEQLRCRPLHHLEAPGLAGTLPDRRDGRERAGRHARSRRHLHQPAHAFERHRLQYQPGQAGGRAQGFQRPARSQVRRQAGQGPSRLFRHHHDGHPADRARARLGLSSRSSPSRRCCRSSRPPSRPRRSRPASAPSPSTAATTCSGWPRSAARRSRWCMRSRARRRSPTRCGVQGGAQSQCGASAGRAGSCRPRARVHRQPERPVSGQQTGQGQGRPAGAGLDQDLARRTRPRSRRRPTRSRPGTSGCSRYERRSLAREFTPERREGASGWQRRSR